MNASVLSCAAILAAVCAIGSSAGVAEGDPVAQMLARARAALGGAAVRDGVQTLVLRGSTTEGSGHTQAHGEFEIAAVLPDKYVRVERRTKSSPPSGGGNLHPAFYSDLHVAGLNGAQPIYRVPLLTARTDLRRATESEARTLRDRAAAECAQFLFGVLAASIDAAPLAFAADPNDAHALIASGGGRAFTVRFDPITHLPAHFGDFEYGDYRDVGSRRVPHLFTKHIAGRLKHVWRVTQAQFNVEVDAKVFRQDTWMR